MALSQRCTGVYAGAALFLCLLPFMNFRPSRRLAVLHAAFIVQMVVLGAHLVPHPAWMRTLSGQIFIVGAFYFLWMHLKSALPFAVSRKHAVCGPRVYLIALLGVVVALQLLVHAPYAAAGWTLEFLALLGVATILLAAAVTLIEFAGTVWSGLRHVIAGEQAKGSWSLQ